jgi:hypothetical protein
LIQPIITITATTRAVRRNGSWFGPRCCIYRGCQRKCQYFYRPPEAPGRNWRRSLSPRQLEQGKANYRAAKARRAVR